MGYWISKLKSLPSTFDWYLFLVGDYRNHNIINDFFRNDFCIIADRIGEDAAIIAQNNSLEDDLQKSLKDVEHGELGIMFRNLEEKIPGLLILNKHPRKLYHFNEFMQNARENIPDNLDYYQRQQYLIDAYNENRCKYDKLQKDDIIIYIPFEVLEKTYTSTNSLISDIITFSKNQNKDLLRKTSKFGRIKNSIDISTSIGINLGIIAINIEL